MLDRKRHVGQVLSPSVPQSLSPSVPQSRRVLIVDDDNASQIFAAKVLERMGLKADVASNGAEAIDFLSRTDYALVLMDCLMPVMDGVEATKRIRDGSANARDPDIPIIAITADVMQENFNACKLAGMNDWITKPVRSAALRESVERWLVHRANLPSNFD